MYIRVELDHQNGKLIALQGWAYTIRFPKFTRYVFPFALNAALVIIHCWNFFNFSFNIGFRISSAAFLKHTFVWYSFLSAVYVFRLAFQLHPTTSYCILWPPFETVGIFLCCQKSTWLSLKRTAGPRIEIDYELKTRIESFTRISLDGIDGIVCIFWSFCQSRRGRG